MEGATTFSRAFSRRLPGHTFKASSRRSAQDRYETSEDFFNTFSDKTKAPSGDFIWTFYMRLRFKQLKCYHSITRQTELN